MKKISIIAALLTLCLLFAACGQATKTSSPEQQKKQQLHRRQAKHRQRPRWQRQIQTIQKKQPDIRNLISSRKQ